ncbi:hypothetical protein FHG87_004070 [Trinorchestia longiramus]|nr:hypothetical protein FHG87_004070 [Trinorchestia longiramus]
MNLTKHDLRLLMLREFKLGHNTSEASANINRAWGEESTRDRTVRRWFGKFWSGDESLKDEEGRGRLGSLENEQLHAVVEQNPRQSVREMSQILGVSIATVLYHSKIIGKVKKLDKWVPHELNENQKLRRFEVCSMLSLRNDNDPFLDRIVTCDENGVGLSSSTSVFVCHSSASGFPPPKKIYQSAPGGIGTSPPQNRDVDIAEGWSLLPPRMCYYYSLLYCGTGLRWPYWPTRLAAALTRPVDCV